MTAFDDDPYRWTDEAQLTDWPELDDAWEPTEWFGQDKPRPIQNLEVDGELL